MELEIFTRDLVQDTATPEVSSRQSGAEALQSFADVAAVVRELRPELPVRCFDAVALRTQAASFVKHFPGSAFYAVKCNPAPHILKTLFAAGVKAFDVASLHEIRLLRSLFPTARLAFMHTVKSREAIAEAYFRHGVRDFAVDTFEELHKIFAATEAASDLGIHVRLALPRLSAAHDLSRKFGAKSEEAVQILRDANHVAHRIGVTFHVGSQCLDPQDYVRAIKHAGDIIRQSGVEIDVFNVGGGFPVTYPGMVTPPLSAYFRTIKTAIRELNLPQQCEIWGEPGRALVASCETVIMRVELRKGEALYLNDGAYGSLFDGRFFGLRYPVSLHRPDGRRAKDEMLPFSFYGPTCDSEDHIPGPFMLPSDMREGDWIAIGQQGAYSQVLKTRFNGFHAEQLVAIDRQIAPRRAKRGRASQMASVT
jgi:ornithine decarboxylase